ncbi:SH3 domain-containing protein [Microvirga arsenatis]|uniref:SH3 domain-containing protein n=1 Tax=Microvirga arsenatis TaxID=2692265 RepID=A0ABW9Z681_9HYPH|nr:SH3 domain-containing protein [Microvirga arsenatis]NBJ13755.1 SH3 domain-containing protein [Microvirga arsenatis]NBJ27205.1 SH3 domain-containing protein [Microvirga arsenatis]
MRFSNTIWLTCALLLGSAASAAEIRHNRIAEGSGFIVVEGELKPGDEDRFDAGVQQYSKGAVLFQSGGGSLITGIRMGEIIRMKNFGTGVAPGTMCASACALAWLGGTQRFMSSSSRVGFHAAYRMTNGAAQESGVGNALLGAYLTRLGLPVSAVIYISRADPSGMTWLTPDDAQSNGIDLTVLDLAPDKSATSRRVGSAPAVRSGAEYHYVTGLDPNGDNWLALKAAPDLKSRRLLKMPPDTPLVVLGRQGTWLNVRLQDGTVGWAAARYVACCRHARN